MSKFLDRLRAARNSGVRPPTSALVESNARRALIAPAPPLPPMAPVFAPPPPCATCGAPSAMFLRDHAVTIRDPATGVIRRRLADFCSRECVMVEEATCPS